MDQATMLALTLAGSGNQDGGSEGGGLNPDLLKILLGQDDEVVESVWEDAVTFGTARDRNGDQTIGVLECRITPPTSEDPHVRIRIKTNGTVFARAGDFAKIAAAFEKFAQDSEAVAAYDEAKEGEKEAAEAHRNSRMQKALVH